MRAHCSLRAAGCPVRRPGDFERLCDVLHNLRGGWVIDYSFAPLGAFVMKIFIRIFEAIAQSRQRHADRVIRQHAHFLRQAHEYELCRTAEMAAKPDAADSSAVEKALAAVATGSAIWWHP